MHRSNVKEAIELLMNSMNQGIIFVDSEGKIQLCNRKAKETTGIIINARQDMMRGRFVKVILSLLRTTSWVMTMV